MILTATHPSAFDSIKRREVASTLSEELSKVPLISSSRMSTQRCSFNLYTPLNIAGPYINCHWECLLVAWHRCSGIHLQRGLETKVMCAICVWQKHFRFNFLFIKVCSASNSEDRTRTLLLALALTLGLLYYKCIKFNETKDLGLWRYFTCIFANFSLCISDGWEELQLARAFRPREFQSRKWGTKVDNLGFHGRSDDGFSQNGTLIASAHCVCSSTKARAPIASHHTED